MLPTCIKYHSTDLYDTYTMYNPADVHWDILNDIMSSYYLHIYQIFGLNGLFIGCGGGETRVVGCSCGSCFLWVSCGAMYSMLCAKITWLVGLVVKSIIVLSGRRLRVQFMLLTFFKI
jgi:hypothetical protein